MVFINSLKGKKLFEGIKDDIIYQECHEKIFKNQPCLYHPIKKPIQYEEFWSEYRLFGIEYVLNKYVTDEIIKQYHIEIPKGCCVKKGDERHENMYCKCSLE